MSSTRTNNEQTFALSDEEREAFGWGDVPIVLSIRMPNGLRCIPTREISLSGVTHYGCIETMEPPPGIDADSWAIRFGDLDEPRRGLLS